MSLQVDPRARAGQHQFRFYTYNPAGRDVIISMWAVDEDEAWHKFDSIYGKETIVDQVIRG